MAACGGLEHIFEKPLPETPTLLESLSPWKQMKSMKTIDHSSFTELFGELHFKENHDHLLDHHHDTPQSPSSTSSTPSSCLSSNLTNENPPPSAPIINNEDGGNLSIFREKNGSSTPSYSPYCQKKQYRHGHSGSFSSMNSESLSLCTEGLGFESFDDVEDLLKNDVCNNSITDCQPKEETKTSFTRNHLHYKKSRTSSMGDFPPPISCIGRSGKPWVCFKSFREGGRFILKEIRIPTQEFLHACRENGRLKLQFVQSDDEFIDEDDDEDVEENNGDIDENDEEDKGDIAIKGEENEETSNCNAIDSS